MRLPSFRPVREALGPGPYRIYTAGNATSLIGTWMQRITVGYLTWEQTHSATWLGLISIADLFPTVFVGPISGVLADRWNRHRMLMISQSLGLAQAAAMAVLYAAGMLSMPLMFAFTAALGVVNAVAQPARLALVSAMVPRDVLASAVAINAIMFNLARFAGPAIASVLISSVGITWAFAANAASYAALLWALANMPEKVRKSAVLAARKRFMQELSEGVTYVLGHRGTTLVLLLMIVSGIASRPLIELLPGFSGQVFNSGATGLAMLTSAIGVGAVAGGAWIAGRPPERSLSLAMIGCSLSGALAVAAFSLTRDMRIAVPLIAIAGFCWTSASICAQSLLQTGIADHLRGRVLSFYGLIVKAMPAIGALSCGIVSDWIGLQPTLFAAALVATLYTIAQFPLRKVIVNELETRATPD